MRLRVGLVRRRSFVAHGDTLHPFLVDRDATTAADVLQVLDVRFGVVYGRRGGIPWATRRNSLDSLLVNRDTTTTAAVSKVLDVGVAVVYRGRGGIS